MMPALTDTEIRDRVNAGQHTDGPKSECPVCNELRDLGPRMRRETTADGRSVLVRDDQEGGRE